MGNELSSLPPRVALCFDDKWLLTAERGVVIRATAVSSARTKHVDQHGSLSPDLRFKVENDSKMLERWLSESDGQDLLSVILIRSDHHPQRALGVSKERLNQRGAAATVNVATEWAGPEHRWLMEKPGAGGAVVQSPELRVNATAFVMTSRYVGRDLALQGAKFVLEVDDATGLLALRVQHRVEEGKGEGEERIEGAEGEGVAGNAAASRPRQRTWRFLSVDEPLPTPSTAPPSVTTSGDRNDRGVSATPSKDEGAGVGDGSGEGGFKASDSSFSIAGFTSFFTKGSTSGRK